jgi:hypothetical protein
MSPASERSCQRPEEEYPPDREEQTRDHRAVGQARRQKQRAKPAGHGNARKEPELTELAIGRLARQLEAQRAFASETFGFDQFPLELEPLVVAIESLSQGGHNRSNQPPFGGPLKLSRRSRLIQGVAAGG